MKFSNLILFISVASLASLALMKHVYADNKDLVMLHCEDKNISIEKQGQYLVIHGFGPDLQYQRYNNIDHPVLGGFDSAKQNKEKTWVFTEIEALDKDYEIIYVFAINNLSLKKIVYERGDIASFKKGSRKEPKVCFPISNPFS